MVFARLNHKYIARGERILFAVQFHFRLALENYKGFTVIFMHVAVSFVGARMLRKKTKLSMVAGKEK